MHSITKRKIKRSRSCLLLVGDEPSSHMREVLALWGNPRVVRHEGHWLLTEDDRRIFVAKKRHVSRVGRPEPGCVVVDTTLGCFGYF